ncbi:MAG: hypothetical protein GC149_05660 [Gammaproteobacteria bacterium]|nr:hypothetical protein [Gammaproteobacteria bacterium]
MKTRPGFLEGVGVALVLSIGGSALFVMFNPFVSAGFLLRLLASGISFAYVLYLLWRSRERIGRVTMLTGWLLLSILIWLWYPPIVLYLSLHLLLLWLVRALYFYNGVLPSLMDLGLHGTASALAIGAGLHTQSLFIGLWTFFLCQALFVFIPSSLQGRRASRVAVKDGEDRFERAHRAAQAAVHKLTSV